MLKNLKIRTKIVLPITLIAFIVFSAATAYSYFFTVGISEKDAINQLDTTSQLIKKSIEYTLTEQKEKIEIAATHDDLSLAELQKILDINFEFYEVFVLDSDGVIINSTESSNIGLDRSDDPYFFNALDKTYIKPAYFSEDTQRDAISVSTPHADGVLVARIELDFFNNLVSDRTGLGNTGESLLAYRGEDGEPVFFTQRRFEEEEIVNGAEQTLVLPIDRALAGDEDVFFEPDYRGIPVIAITKYIEEVDMGLVVKIDQAEAFFLSKKLLVLSLVSFSIVLLIFFVVAFLIARMIDRPIKALYQGTEIITKGNLDHKVAIDSKDEIGQLSRSFDKMTDSLKKNRLLIEKKVEERTEQLQKTNDFMIGRELKMVDLKNEIIELKKKLGNKSGKNNS